MCVWVWVCAHVCCVCCLNFLFAFCFVLYFGWWEENLYFKKKKGKKICYLNQFIIPCFSMQQHIDFVAQETGRSFWRINYLIPNQGIDLMLACSMLQPRHSGLAPSGSPVVPGLSLSRNQPMPWSIPAPLTQMSEVSPAHLSSSHSWSGSKKESAV